jgi:hypothetical protein
MSARPSSIDWAFWSCAAGAMGLHAGIVLSAPELRGGADLLPHLRLIELMSEAPALRNVYAPAYHALGALVTPLTGIALYLKLFTLAAAAIWIAAFRFFQRAADLPSASSALFALAPYSFALSSCPPKVEVLGYSLAFLALGLLARRRYAAVAAVLAATFWVHTASALFLGIAGGVFALASRDLRGLGALALGSLGAAPLLAAHLGAGCTPMQALMFSENDYLRATADWSSARIWDVICILASPIAVILATLGARPLWRHSRPLAVTCAVLLALYLNELWLGPLETRTTLDLLRGLSVLAFPVAIAGGLALRARRRALPWALAACALWAVGASVWIVPRTFHTRELSLSELRDLRVARCVFRWRGPAIQRPRRHRPAPVTEPPRQAVPPLRSGWEPSWPRRNAWSRHPAREEDTLSKLLPRPLQKNGDRVPRQAMDRIEQVDRVEADRSLQASRHRAEQLQDAHRHRVARTLGQRLTHELAGRRGVLLLHLQAGLVNELRGARPALVRAPELRGCQSSRSLVRRDQQADVLGS